MAPGAADISGKVMFVTGAGRGIGRGIAEVAAESGADVAINALTPRYVEGVAERLAKETGRRVVPIVGDVTTPAGAAEATASVIAELGRLDILVNCLGDAIAKPLASPPDGERQGMTDEEVQKVMDLNLSATIACTRAASDHLLGRRSGRVVNISSFAAARRGAGTVIYATAKTALTGFTRALALEWAPYGITVNAVAPGSFPDPVTSGDRFEEARARIAGEVPLGRAGEVREIGYAVRFLASPDADYITGQTLYVDGGMSLL
ncbi:MAG: SDR family oxidoreductase [Acidimicrobiales bacterium]|nr:SDR family oxidoreductase [Acidimicrobiales bacterium]MBO0893335.1 SDR family oxidoreductase [Acidimicrobiales bacterium]